MASYTFLMTIRRFCSSSVVAEVWHWAARAARFALGHRSWIARFVRRPERRV